jgi:predicted HNH restriction endonuclease
VQTQSAEGASVAHPQSSVASRKTEPSKVKRRLLDPEFWVVTSYDVGTGQFVITRGAEPFQDVEPSDPEYAGFEGDLKLKYVKHRRREKRLRAKKIMAAKYEDGGRLICEVPRCGFDFFERYGQVGQDFAHVHHTVPLAEAPDTGRNTPLNELKIVCANCHAMIHRYGKCLPLEGLIP